MKKTNNAKTQLTPHLFLDDYNEQTIKPTGLTPLRQK